MERRNRKDISGLMPPQNPPEFARLSGTSATGGRPQDFGLAGEESRGFVAFHHLRQRRDDGKSTLIGRLLWESQLLMDQVAALWADSQRHGTQGSEMDQGSADGLPPNVSRASLSTSLTASCHAVAQVYRCRYPGARAVYPEYDHRRLNR